MDIYPNNTFNTYLFRKIPSIMYEGVHFQEYYI